MQNLSTRPAWARAAIYFGIFVFLLVLNRLSLYIADDYVYLYSFHDRSRIESLSQIIMSMRAHRYKMNGRLVAHVLVQLFGMWPMWVFDVVNALVFTLQIALIYKIARGKYAHEWPVPIGVFCLVWLFCPAFGQVNLWQDGACNYLWSVVIGLLYLGPYIEGFLRGHRVEKWWDKVCFLCLSFGMGAYSETVSAAAIGMSVLLVLLMGFYNKQKIQSLLLWALMAAFLGYASIYTAPAQLNGKSAELTLGVLLDNIVIATDVYMELCGLLLAGFALLLALNIWKRTPPRSLLLASVFFLGSIAANYIMIFASYYAYRSAVGAFAFLLTADMVLLFPLLAYKCYRRGVMAALVLLIMCSIPALVSGTRDVANTYHVMCRNEVYLNQCSKDGVLDVTLTDFSTETHYSEASGLVYVDLEDPTNYPNKHMARFFGLDSVVGLPEE